MLAILHLLVVAFSRRYNALYTEDAVLLAAAVKFDAHTDFSKLRNSQLKQLLKDRGAECTDCFEKSDFVNRVQQLAAASV